MPFTATCRPVTSIPMPDLLSLPPEAVYCRAAALDGFALPGFGNTGKIDGYWRCADTQLKAIVLSV